MPKWNNISHRMGKRRRKKKTLQKLWTTRLGQKWTLEKLWYSQEYLGTSRSLTATSGRRANTAGFAIDIDIQSSSQAKLLQILSLFSRKKETRRLLWKKSRMLWRNVKNHQASMIKITMVVTKMNFFTMRILKKLNLYTGRTTRLLALSADGKCTLSSRLVNLCEESRRIIRILSQSYKSRNHNTTSK